MHQSTIDICTRMDNAERNFIESLSLLGSIDEDKAVKVMNFYLHHKLAKLDWRIGKISVVHGGFLERAVIRRALKQAEA